MQYQLIIAYDGAAFCGWQEQAGLRSVSGSLRQVLEKIAQHPVALEAASRTDAGVHARGQVACFHSDKVFSLASLNQLLPDDIAVLKIQPVHESFHPSLDALRKEYRYYLCTASYQLPEHRRYSWHYPESLNLSAARDAKEGLVGSLDFSAFCHRKEDKHYKSFHRTVESIEIDALCHQRFCFKVVGQRFLHKMVRILVGSLVFVGKGKIKANDLSSALERRDAGVTAPAHGLFLQRIDYPASD